MDNINGMGWGMRYTELTEASHRQVGRFGRWLWISVVCLPGLVPVCSTLRAAEENIAVTSSYGAGVHAYYDGNYSAAYDALTASIEAGTMDPRAYYYRGLTAIKLGRTDDEIEGDFAEGSNRETAGRGGISISRSLERIQGRDRMRLEKDRQRARVAAAQRDESAIRQRYIGVEQTAPDVLRRRVPDSIAPSAEPLIAPAPRGRGPARPADDVRRPAPQVAPKRAQAAEEDPFAPPAERDTSDPFGDDPVTDDPLRDDVLDQRDEQMEERAAETNDGFDQRDQRDEERAAELDDRLDQIDAQQEREAAGGF